MTNHDSRPPRVRMAPAPTGAFHVGNARTALYNWLFARHEGGSFILRIEDTDVARSSAQHLASMLEALRWLGLEWDEGPEVGGDYGPYLQSQRLELYRELAQELLAKGKAYPCFCTPEELEARRREVQARGLPPKYDRRCLSLTEAQRQALRYHAQPEAIRFKMPEEGVTGWNDLIRGGIEFQNNLLDDFVLMRSNGYPSYLFAVVVDDAAMAISHVIRGEDLISATPRQILLYQALGRPIPEFGHLPLLLGPGRAKLSKRQQEKPLLAYRDEGYLPEALFNFLALLGWAPGDDREIMSPQEIIAAFSLDRVGKSGAVFDQEKLDWMNGHYLRHLPLERYLELAHPFLARAGLSGEEDYLRRALALEQERIRRLEEVPGAVEFFLRDPESFEAAGEKKWFATPGAAERLGELAVRLGALENFAVAEIEGVVRGLAGELGVAAGKLIHPLRLAVTGRTAGPGLFELLEVLGPERTLRRLERAAQRARELQGGG